MAAYPSPLTAENFKAAWKYIARKQRWSMKKSLIRRIAVMLAQIVYGCVFVIMFALGELSGSEQGPMHAVLWRRGGAVLPRRESPLAAAAESAAFVLYPQNHDRRCGTLLCPAEIPRIRKRDSPRNVGPRNAHLHLISRTTVYKYMNVSHTHFTWGWDYAIISSQT